jgi:hypothetical protein
MLECNTQGSPVAQQLFQSLMSCVLQACFPPPPSVQCMIQSFMGQCNAEYQKCSAN